jgi:galactokinase
MKITELIKTHEDFLQGQPNVYFSPGRVNLIGEHIDYLGGRVFPSAISLGTYALVTKRADKEFHFISHNFLRFGSRVVTLEHLEYDSDRNWVNYLSGMIKFFIDRGVTIDHGLNIVVYGTLPNGAGLSSSASIEVLMGVILKDVFSVEISMIDMVRMAQDVENRYIGLQCGIMDQFAVGMSQQNTAIYLDTNTLDYELVPLDLKNHVILIGNTNKKRSLSSSKYNERRSECDKGLEILKADVPNLKALCELSSTQFEEYQHHIMDQTIYKRVHHAVTENERTKEAVVALKRNDITRFGELMNQSHESLKKNFEVSCYELDVMVESLQEHGAIGARMTGAGFGGCTVAIVPKNDVDTIIDKVRKDYNQQTKYKADFYICETHDGARPLTKEEWQ